MQCALSWMAMATAHTIVTTTHGRYLIEPPRQGTPCGLLVGFHGYAEPAETQLERLRSIPGSADWLLVSIQGLHRFYNRRSEEVVASWMTRQDRELAIADNLRFVDGVVDAAARDVARRHFRSCSPVSRKVWRWRFARPAMSPVRSRSSSRLAATFRPSSTGTRSVAIPGGVRRPGQPRRVVLAEKWAADQARLEDAGVDLTAFGFDGGHEWNGEVSAAAGTFLQRVTSAAPLTPSIHSAIVSLHRRVDAGLIGAFDTLNEWSPPCTMCRAAGGRHRRRDGRQFARASRTRRGFPGRKGLAA